MACWGLLGTGVLQTESGSDPAQLEQERAAVAPQPGQEGEAEFSNTGGGCVGVRGPDTPDLAFGRSKSHWSFFFEGRGLLSGWGGSEFQHSSRERFWGETGRSALE